MRTHLRLLAVLAAVALLGACGITWDSSGGDASPSVSPTSSSPASSSPAPSSPSPSGTPGTGASPSPSGSAPADLREQPRVVAAIDDTATREGIPVGDVVVAAWSPVTWSGAPSAC